jgi:two-component system, chemotaxis family, sensor kinase CheA
MMDFASPEERASYVLIFRQEAEEQWRAMAQGIVALSASPGEQLLAQEPYRAAHTLKGSAAYLGFEEVRALSLALEGVFRAVYEGRMGFPLVHRVLLLETLESLHRLITQDGPVSDDAPSQVAGLVARLRDLGPTP